MLITNPIEVAAMFNERIAPYVDNNYINLLENVYYIQKNKPVRQGAKGGQYDLWYNVNRSAFIIDFIFEHKAYLIPPRMMRDFIKEQGRDFSEQMNLSVGYDKV